MITPIPGSARRCSIASESSAVCRAASRPVASCVSVGRSGCSELPPTSRKLVPTGCTHSGRPPLLSAGGAASAPVKRASHRTNAGGGGLGDEMLDFLYAGKKLRKWYGEEGMVLPKDGGPPRPPQQEEEQQDANAVKDSVLVLDVDSAPMAEQVLLQLILARAKLKAVVKDVAAARSGFGPYVDIVNCSSSDGALMRRALQGVQSLVLCGRVPPQVLAAAAAAGVPHLVLLSAAGSVDTRGFVIFGDGEMSTLRDVQREQAVTRSGITYTIIRVGRLTDAPGGSSQLQLTGGSGVGGAVGREDAALALAEAARRDPAGGSVECSLSSPGPGEAPQDWGAVFQGLRAKAAS